MSHTQSQPTHLVPSLLPRIRTASQDTMTVQTQQSPLSAASTSSAGTISGNSGQPLQRLDSNNSISSSSKTASFFASSPVMTPPPASKPTFASHPPPALHLDLSSGSEDGPRPSYTQPSFLSLGPSTSRHSRNDSSSSTSSLSPFSNAGGLKSASSVRSRRNWDEFEGKPITPLPSPNVHAHAEMESSDSMYSDDVAATTTATHSPTPSKTSNFFGTTHAATPPTVRRPPVKKSSSSSNDGDNHNSIPTHTQSPSLPSWPSIVSNGSSRDASPSTRNAVLPEHYQRPSRFPTLPSQEQAPRSQPQLRLPALPTSPLLQHHIDDAMSNTPSLGLGPPPPFDSKGKAATSRHVHGPSENATGSSLAPFSASHDEQQAPQSQPPRQPTPAPTDDGTPSASPRITPRDVEIDADVADESEDEGTGRVGNYHIEKTLGVGAFSRVVLASPIESDSVAASTPLPQPHKRRSMPWSRAWRRSSAIVSSTPQTSTDSAIGGSSGSATPSASSSPDPSRSPVRGLRARLMSSSNTATTSSQAPQPPRPQTPDPFATSPPPGALVALKMLAREPCAQNERMKVSWVREVEVLKHVSHPCLIKVFHSFSTPKHHVLVLERIAGGELFDYLASHHNVIAKREWLARRLCSELANAVGWMHSVNLVHRDIKLENIILTRSIDDEETLRPSSLGPIPLLKVTDFGLSRFIDPTKPLLETRCGSEEYASPELIIGKKYDGRKTDVWSMGVVFYAILSGMLPFGDLEEDDPTTLPTSSREGGDPADVDPRVRKARLLRIAKGDLRYPSKCNDDSLDQPPCPAKYRLLTPTAKALLSRLLRRDAGKRANAWDIWDDEWLLRGSFEREQTAYGEDADIVPDPKSDVGRAWLASRAGVKGGEVSTLARAD